MSRRLALTIVLSTCVATGLIASSSWAGEAKESVESRKDVRETAGVEPGDRGDKRREVRESTDPSDRAEARESAGVEAGDRRGKRKEVREAVR
jgi:hypothetical protein